jgi:hypothetical protein
MRRLLALLVGWVPVAGALAAPPARADGTHTADLHLVYQSPQVAEDGTGVTWSWALSNDGGAAADSVVATQHVSPGQRIVAVSAPCTDRPGEVECRLGSLRPGEHRTGWIRTSVPAESRGLRVDGRVTWHETPARDLPPIDAGAAPGAIR